MPYRTRKPSPIQGSMMRFPKPGTTPSIPTAGYRPAYRPGWQFGEAIVDLRSRVQLVMFEPFGFPILEMGEPRMIRGSIVSVYPIDVSSLHPGYQGAFAVVALEEAVTVGVIPEGRLVSSVGGGVTSAPLPVGALAMSVLLLKMSRDQIMSIPTTGLASAQPLPDGMYYAGAFGPTLIED